LLDLMLLWFQLPTQQSRNLAQQVRQKTETLNDDEDMASWMKRKLLRD
jgi:hypothetical protein